MREILRDTWNCALMGCADNHILTGASLFFVTLWANFKSNDAVVWLSKLALHNI